CLEQLGFDREEILDIDHWLCYGEDPASPEGPGRRHRDGRRRFRTAQVALEHVARLNLSSTMDDAQRAYTMSVVRAPAIPAPRPPSNGATSAPHPVVLEPAAP